jgi:hypothetical protein
MMRPRSRILTNRLRSFRQPGRYKPERAERHRPQIERRDQDEP